MRARLAEAFRIYADRRILVMLALGFSAGAPLPLTGFTLRQWFSESGIALGAIGLTSLIGLSYTLKFVWAPALDRLEPPLPLGRRRGWLVPIQLALIAAIAALSFTDPVQDAVLVVTAGVVVAFLSASQDIVIDAARIEMMPPEQQGAGLAAYIWGYRLALLASGAGVLFLVEAFDWQTALLLAALLPAVGIVATLCAPEGAPPPPAPHGLVENLRHSVIGPFRDFMQRRGWLLILAFVALYRLGEALAGVMTAPFYRSIGFSRTEVAAVSGMFGMVATLGGAAVGGMLVAAIGLPRSLILTGMGQMLSNLMYVALARAGHSVPMLYWQVGIESFTDGLADAAFVAYLSGLTSIAFTATQYALLSSLAALPLRTLGATGGFLAEAMGWERFFLLTTAAALPAMGMMLVLLRRFPAGEAGVAAPPPPRPSPAGAGEGVPPVPPRPLSREAGERWGGGGSAR
jgi:PAT family beta-lactamase induction signal transducer AmpG